MKNALSPEQALERMLAAGAALPLPGREMVPLDEACGRVAAGELRARMNQPPFDRSPLDGYALRSADIAGADREHPVSLPVSMQLFAGDVPAEPLRPGTAARIMTGAPIPRGADCVLMQERTDGGEETVQLYQALRPGSNICQKGEDMAEGAVIAAAGEVLTPVHLGVLAGQGIAEVPVYACRSVGILATGSELLALGEPWVPGRIYDASGAQNAARLRQLGFTVCRTSCADDPEIIAEQLRRLCSSCDAVITTGGVSVGQKDYLPIVLEQLGAEPVLQGVRQKPGSPMMAAVWQGKLIVCLSGNPFAAVATFEQYAVPALLRMAGRREADCRLPIAGVTLTTGFSKASPQCRFLRARAVGGEAEIPGEGNAEAHSSGSLSAMIGCNCLVKLPAGSPPAAAGETVEVHYFVQQ